MKNSRARNKKIAIAAALAAAGGLFFWTHRDPTIAWTPTAGHSYKIYRKLGGQDWQQIGDTITGLYTDARHVPKGTEYRVTAVNQAGESLPSNVITTS